MEAKMKKTVIIMVLFAALGCGFVDAQEAGKKYSFQTNPTMLVADLIMGTIEQDTYSYYMNFEFQYAINNHWNFVIRPNFFIGNSFFDLGIMKGFFNGSYKITEDSEVTGVNIIFSIMPGIIYRPFGGGLKGMYLGLYPNIGWENKKYEQKDIKLNIKKVNDNFLILGVGIEGGYEWVFRNGFTITVGSGLERNWDVELGEIKGDYKAPGYLYNFRLNTMIGYTF
jgi:hypothetical protein